ncbi:uncharacterized protein SPSC_00681 [Sporisorium scitamineum]|uniref:INO80 complex subunit F domain-containing protein n=1 Tax=Sporisorium scitamineum TaxID=49012 RepID=A0A0F7RV82_9BASI|nr:hypothetical protein [Sporisorium scitamineum]CDU22051.1 uncharacterized protein SPSC_00681 [Sporisorium scitamineum]
MAPPKSATQPVKTKSKAYSSTVAIQGDAAKYRLKYKELKRKVREIEFENDKLHYWALFIKRRCQRMRLERSLILDFLVTESQATPRTAGYPPPQHYQLDARRGDPYTAAGGAGPGSSSGLARGGAGEYAGYGAASGGASSSAYRQGPPFFATAAAPPVPSSRAVYGYAPPPPPPARSHPIAEAYPNAHAAAHPHAYVPSSYDSRHHSPPPQPPAAPTGDRAERLRQYTDSPSPEPASRRGDMRGATLPLTARPSDAAASAADAGLSPSSSRSNMKVTIRRGA